jgi:hypothetical protein
MVVRLSVVGTVGADAFSAGKEHSSGGPAMVCFGYCRALNAPAKKTSGALIGEVRTLSMCPTTIQ